MADSGGRALTPGSAYSGGMHASGYHTPDLATRSSSPGSGSFHTANPMDSERSSPAGEDRGEWERERRDELSSVEIPSLDGETMLQAGQRRQDMVDSPGSEEEEEEATLRNSPSPLLAREGAGRGAEGRNWIDQPKLIPADLDTVPPCPQKRPLGGSVPPRHSRRNDRETVRETAPLLSSSSRQSSRSDRSCCSVL